MDPPERDDDMLAAEHVLGVLDAGERAAAAARIERDSVFARLVDAWEVRLAGLAEAYLPVQAPESVKTAVDRRLFAAGAAAADRPGLLASLAFWRVMTALAVAALLLFVALPYLRAPTVEPQTRLVASLAAADSPVSYLAVYEAGTGKVGLSHVSGDREPDHDFELWMIESGSAPVSMGVIPVGSSVELVVADALRTGLAAGATLAVTLEPAGGAPGGIPTGPVVAAGELRSI